MKPSVDGSSSTFVNHSPSLETVLSALDHNGCKPTQSGSGYVAYCPVHEGDGHDHKPSLSVSAGDKVPVVIHCHAGCAPIAVFKALSIEPDTDGKPGTGTGKRIVAAYKYCDASGHVLFEKVRYEPKDFRIRHQDASGATVWKRPPDIEPPLYRLPDVLAAIAAGEPVYVTEGEKDADRLVAAGLHATTNFEGAAKGTQRAKWRDSYTAALTGADVVLLPDHDEPGTAHMRHVAAALSGKARVVRYLELPGLSGAKGDNDLSDWLNKSHTIDDLKVLAANAGPENTQRAAYFNAGAQPAAGAELPPDRAFDRHHPALMRKTGSSQLLKNHYNAVMVVENAFPGLVGYNEFRQRIEARIPSPWRQTPGQWTEADTGELAFHVAKEFASFTLDALSAAIMTVAHRHHFNPAQERLRALAEQWDGSRRLEQWLVEYLGAAVNNSNAAYLAEIGSAWMKGVAGRVLFPGCKRDDVLILRSEQGFLKSTAALAIAEAIHPDSFTDSLGNLDSKDSKAAIRGIIIAELGELSVLNKSDLESIKVYVATRADHFREAYGRGERDYPRTVSFIGTTNHPTFLKDPTGNRRFWPVTIPAPINITRFKEILPQLLGEAARRVLDGEKWFVDDRTALTQAEAVRAAHFQDDVWTEAALNAAHLLLSPNCTLEGANSEFVTVAAILNTMGVRIEQQTVTAQTRIGGILRVAGWRDRKKRVGDWRANKTVWAWYPPTVPPVSTVPPTVPPSRTSQIAAVPPVPPCSPYLGVLTKMDEGGNQQQESSSSAPPTRRSFLPFV